MEGTGQPHLPTNSRLIISAHIYSSTNLVAQAAPPGRSAYAMQHLDVQQNYEYDLPSRTQPGWDQYPSPQIDTYEPIQHPYPPSKRHSGLAYDEPIEDPNSTYPRYRHIDNQPQSQHRL
jgi:hypothetical protein